MRQDIGGASVGASVGGQWVRQWVRQLVRQLVRQDYSWCVRIPEPDTTRYHDILLSSAMRRLFAILACMLLVSNSCSLLPRPYTLLASSHNLCLHVPTRNTRQTQTLRHTRHVCRLDA